MPFFIQFNLKLLSALFSIIILMSSLSWASIDRREWVQVTYQNMPILLKSLQNAGLIKDDASLELLVAIESFFNETKRPELVFVNDSSQFVMSEGEEPRLMRAPENQDGPIFINTTKLNSNNLNLNLPQLIKLLLHELGHKTSISTVGRRDTWAQGIEDLLMGFYNTVENTDGIKLETLSLSDKAMPISFNEDRFTSEPSVLVFYFNNEKATSIGDQILEAVDKRLQITRNFSTDINDLLSQIFAGLGSEVVNVTSQAFNPFASIVESLTGQTIDLSEELELGSIKFMSLLAINFLRINSNGDIIIDGTYFRYRSQRDQITIEEESQSFPFDDQQLNSIEIKIPTINQWPVPELMQIEPLIDLSDDKTALVKNITRIDGSLSSLEVEVQGFEKVYAMYLVLNTEQGSMLLHQSYNQNTPEIYQTHRGVFKAKFDLTTPQAQLGRSSYKVIVNNQVAIPLNRHLELNQGKVQPNLPLTADDIGPKGVGIMVTKNSQIITQYDLSHQKPVSLFPPVISTVMNLNKFMFADPSGFWIEFDVKNGIEFSSIELMASLEQFIIEAVAEDGKDLPVITVNEQTLGKTEEQFYSFYGKSVDHSTLKIVVSAFYQGIKVSPSKTPGYHTLKVPFAMAIPHQRALDRLKKEAYYPASLVPISLKLTSSRGAQFTYNFSSSIEDLNLSGEIFCNGVVKGD